MYKEQMTELTYQSEHQKKVDLNVKNDQLKNINTTSFKDSVLDIIYGSIAGSSGKLIEYPFDTVKVRLQTQPQNASLYFNGPLDCFKHTIKNEGFLGLYRGISSPIVGAAAENACLFFVYNISQDQIKKNFYNNQIDVLPIPALFTAGAISGAFASFVLTPIELIKCQMQVQRLYSTPETAKHNGIIYLVKEVVKKEGLKGFWKGQTGTFLRESGGSASWFGAYEYVSLFFRNYHKRETNTIGELLISGACGGIAYNASLFPADTIKSKMQTDSIISGSSKSQGFLEVGKEIYTANGIKGFYRGMGITLLRAAPASATIFLVYEKLKEFGNNYINPNI